MTKRKASPEGVLHVGPIPFTVKVDNDACVAGGVSGATMNDSQLIFIQDKVALQTMQDTLLHESMHAIWNQTSLTIEYPDADADSPGEKLIRTLAPRILALLKDNPWFLDFLTRDE